MSIRKIIEIDEAKCNGCGLCVPNCAEGAIKIIDGKARLISDVYCDGLGACLGHCPEDALKIVEREAEEFDEEAVIEARGQGGCPGSRMMDFKEEDNESTGELISSGDIEINIKPQLKQWPVQLKLVPVNAPYFNNSDLLITADCVPFAYPNYHLDLLKGRSVVVGCPKLDDLQFYIKKLTQIIKENNLNSVTVAYMEVPCCQGIVMAAEAALKAANKDIPLNKVKIGINGKK
ncbi:4Fe-4S ferredoxin [Alkaliphilus pronyensis]|uniref:4Fe-4S ferredoxin n=1 Tax=Alkaliphilus pronyensis TaxID=1482732 RepID=A0A6I0F204_9FIRM|nr:4Fe-4S binding protein [Alkaliphilus pronyensis]KAB3535302.1 4Fe-4S ferredoxin [Alkaliphilus pronyensis]